MLIANVEWDIDLPELAAEIVEEGDDAVVEIIGKEVTIYDEINKTSEGTPQYGNVSVPVSELTDDLKMDFIEDYFRHRPGALYDYCKLPEKVIIPDEVAKEDAKYEDHEVITEWLSDYYGYCHYGYTLEEVSEPASETRETA